MNLHYHDGGLLLYPQDSSMIPVMPVLTYRLRGDNPLLYIRSHLGIEL